MKKIVFIIMALIFAGGAKAEAIDKDRWVELDLYWFQRSDMKGSCDKFWKTMTPLYDNISGERGVILNIGWLMDLVLEWNGDLGTRIAFPKNMTIESQWSDEGFLWGSTDERKELWEARFGNARPKEIVNYEPWTYGDVRKFIQIFKKSAERHGVKGIRVGTFVLGWERIYQGNNSVFFKRHPGATTTQLNPARFFNPTHILADDDTKYGAYPDGIKAGLPIVEFFAGQWGDMSKAVGFEALVLRDSAVGPGIYLRRGPFGLTASADPDECRRWSKAMAGLVRMTKQANPDVFLMGYSNGGAAISDWRVNLFDIEAIAKEGYLDAYIDQTWAGAFCEVGQRHLNRFWNTPMQGWSYQLGFMLMHATMFVNTNTKHYFLSETFDAWETWNIINTARNRLRWGIWAWSHAAVKKPDGSLKFPDGSYISWGNQARRLLDDDQVDFLKTETDAAFRDLETIADVNGPTLVYSRSAMEWQMENKPAETMKEWIDETAGSLMKWNVPILSATRIEWLDRVKSDLFIVQTPIHLKPAEQAGLDKLLDAGKPVLIIGSPANGVDPAILKRLEFSGEGHGSHTHIEERGSLGGASGDWTEDLQNSFLLYQYYTKNKVLPAGGARILYTVAESPMLVHKDNLIVWDAPEIIYNLPDHLRYRCLPMDENLGSVVPYALVSRIVTGKLAEEGAFRSSFEHPNNPVWVGAWTRADGNLTVLAAELEDGFDHTDSGHSTFDLYFPSAWSGRNMVSELWDGRMRFVTGRGHMKYTLRKSESKLFRVEKLD